MATLLTEKRDFGERFSLLEKLVLLPSSSVSFIDLFIALLFITGKADSAFCPMFKELIQLFDINRCVLFLITNKYKSH